VGGQTLSAKILEERPRSNRTRFRSSLTLCWSFLRRTPQNVLTFAAYEALGGLAKVPCAQRAEKAFADLSPEQQAACPELLSRARHHGSGFRCLRSSPPGEQGATLRHDRQSRSHRRVHRMPGLSAAYAERQQKVMSRWLMKRPCCGNGSALPTGFATTASISRSVLGSSSSRNVGRWRGERDNLLLAEGLELEEGLSLFARRAAFGRGCGVCVDQGLPQKHPESFTQQRSSVRSNEQTLVVAGMAVLTAIAVAGSIWAMRQTASANHNQGLSFLARARIADETGHQYPQILFYAARAVGMKAGGDSGGRWSGKASWGVQKRRPVVSSIAEAGRQRLRGSSRVSPSEIGISSILDNSCLLQRQSRD